MPEYIGTPQPGTGSADVAGGLTASAATIAPAAQNVIASLSAPRALAAPRERGPDPIKEATQQFLQFMAIAQQRAHEREESAKDRANAVKLANIAGQAQLNAAKEAGVQQRLTDEARAEQERRAARLGAAYKRGDSAVGTLLARAADHLQQSTTFGDRIAEIERQGLAVPSEMLNAYNYHKKAADTLTNPAFLDDAHAYYTWRAAERTLSPEEQREAQLKPVGDPSRNVYLTPGVPMPTQDALPKNELGKPIANPVFARIGATTASIFEFVTTTAEKIARIEKNSPSPQVSETLPTRQTFGDPTLEASRAGARLEAQVTRQRAAYAKALYDIDSNIRQMTNVVASGLDTLRPANRVVVDEFIAQVIVDQSSERRIGPGSSKIALARAMVATPHLERLVKETRDMLDQYDKTSGPDASVLDPQARALNTKLMLTYAALHDLRSQLSEWGTTVKATGPGPSTDVGKLPESAQKFEGLTAAVRLREMEARPKGVTGPPAPRLGRSNEEIAAAAYSANTTLAVQYAVDHLTEVLNRIEVVPAFALYQAGREVTAQGFTPDGQPTDGPLRRIAGRVAQGDEPLAAALSEINRFASDRADSVGPYYQWLASVNSLLDWATPVDIPVPPKPQNPIGPTGGTPMSQYLFPVNQTRILPEDVSTLLDVRNFNQPKQAGSKE